VTKVAGCRPSRSAGQRLATSIHADDELMKSHLNNPLGDRGPSRLDWIMLAIGLLMLACSIR